MKRHPQLIPLSKEHQSALRLALYLQREPGSAQTNVLLAKEIPVLLAHFVAEESLINQLPIPFTQQDLLQRFTDEHAQLRQYLQMPIKHEDHEQLGELLHDHVRFEERELFPALEAHGLVIGE